MRPGRIAGDEGGAAAVEFALILPVFALVLFGAIEFGRLAWMQSSLNYTVQETARCAAIASPTCATAALAQAHAAAETQTLAYTAPANAFTVTQAACGWQVSASVPYQFALYQLFGSAPTLTARACKS